MMKLSFDKVDDIVAEKFNNFFPIANSLIEVNPGRVFLPHKFAEIAESILNLPIYSDDVWLVSYPRTGTHYFPNLHFVLEISNPSVNFIFTNNSLYLVI